MDELNDIEKEKLINFMNDEVLVNAVRKVMLATIYTNGTLRKEMKPKPLQNAALAMAMAAVNGSVILTNEQIGEDVRGIAQAINLMETGFIELSKIKKVDSKPEEPKNPAI